MNEQQKQQLKEILSKFSDKEIQDLKEQMGVDLSTELNPETIDPELAALLIDSGVLEKRPSLTKVEGGDNHCSFCQQSTDTVGALITSPSGAKICHQCIMKYQSGQ